MGVHRGFCNRYKGGGKDGRQERGYRGGGYQSYPSDSRAAMRGAAKTTESNTIFGYRFAIYLGEEE